MLGRPYSEQASLGAHSSRLHRLSLLPQLSSPGTGHSDLSSEALSGMARSQSLGVPTCRRVEGTWGWSGPLMALPTLAGDRVRYVPTGLCVPGAGSCLGLRNSDWTLVELKINVKACLGAALPKDCQPMCFGSLGEKSSCHLQDVSLEEIFKVSHFVACSSRPHGHLMKSTLPILMTPVSLTVTLDTQA